MLTTGLIKESLYFAKYLAQQSCECWKLLIVAITFVCGGNIGSGKLVDVMVATMGIVHSFILHLQNNTLFIPRKALHTNLIKHHQDAPFQVASSHYVS